MKSYRFGCCVPGGKPDRSVYETLTEGCRAILAGGFSYAECGVGTLMRLSEEELQRLEAEALPIEVCNGFLPADYAIADAARVDPYVEEAMKRMHRLGVGIVVFGSGKARAAPAGMGLEEGMRGVVRFLEMCSAAAAQYGVSVAIEPLNRRETNLIHTLREGSELVRSLSLPHIALLADAFHMFCEQESPEEALAEAEDVLIHIHIAETPDRSYPGRHGGEYLRPFAEALRRTSYSGRITAECGYSDFPSESRKALHYMESIFT